MIEQVLTLVTLTGEQARYAHPDGTRLHITLEDHAHLDTPRQLTITIQPGDTLTNA